MSPDVEVKLKDVVPYPTGHVGGMYSSAPISYPVEGNIGLASPSISTITPTLAPASAATPPCKCKSVDDIKPGTALILFESNPVAVVQAARVLFAPFKLKMFPLEAV